MCFTCSSLSSAKDSWTIGFLGMTRKWTGACGLTSWNARHCSSSWRILAGISLRMILPKMVSPPTWAVWDLATSSLICNAEMVKFLVGLAFDCSANKGLKNVEDLFECLKTKLIGFDFDRRVLRDISRVWFNTCTW